MKEKLESTYWTRLKERAVVLLAIASFSGIVFVIDELYPLFRWGLSYHSIESFKRSWPDGNEITMLVGLFFIALLILPFSLKAVMKNSKVNKDKRTEKKMHELSQLSAPGFLKTFENVTLLGTGTQNFKKSGVYYNYLEFTAEGGEVLKMPAGAFVSNQLNMNFIPGEQGTFYFAYIDEWTLLCSDARGGKRSSELLVSSFMLRSLVSVTHFPFGRNGFANFGFYFITLGLGAVIPLALSLFESIRTRRGVAYLKAQGFVFG